MGRLRTRLEERDGELVPIVMWGIDPSEEIYDTREEYELDREITKQNKER
jgi:hypothetical protein